MHHVNQDLEEVGEVGWGRGGVQTVILTHAHVFKQLVQHMKNNCGEAKSLRDSRHCVSLQYYGIRRSRFENLQREDESNTFSEPGVEEDIDDGIQTGVKMGQPDLDSNKGGVDRRVFTGQRGEIVRTEAAEKDHHDHAQNPGGLDLRLPGGCRRPSRHCGDLRLDAASCTQHHHKHPHVQHDDDADGDDEGEDEVEDSCQVADDDHTLTQAGAGVARFLQVLLQKHNPVEDGAKPAQQHNVLHPSVGHLGGVVEREADGHVAVDGDEHHACY